MYDSTNNQTEEKGMKTKALKIERTQIRDDFNDFT
jgi:hypothetical protein